MDFISTKEAAVKWHVNERRVRFLAKSGRITGAVYTKHSWKIPIDAAKPTYEQYLLDKGNKRYPKEPSFFDTYLDYGKNTLPKSFENYFLKLVDPLIELIASGELDSLAHQYLIDTPIFESKKFLNSNIRLFIKREDLNLTNSIYINIALPYCLLAKKLGKTRIICEANNIDYAFSIAYSVAIFNLSSLIVIGYNDYILEANRYEEMKKYNAKLILVTTGNKGIHEATNYAFKKYLKEENDSLYVFHDAIGVNPIFNISEFFLSTIGKSSKKQLKDLGIERVNGIVAPINIASNSLAIYSSFTKRDATYIGIESSDHPSISKLGNTNALYGFISKSIVEKSLIKDIEGHLCYNLSTPILHPKLSYLIDTKIIKIKSISDSEAKEACLEFYEKEGILPTLEDGYSLAYLKQISKKRDSGTYLICITRLMDKNNPLFKK